MKNLLFLLSILFLSSSVKADMGPYGVYDVILHSSIAVVGKAVEHEKGEVKILISHVVMDRGYGLKANDYIRVQYDPHMVCPVLNYTDIQVGKNLMGFLNKTKDGWRFSFYQLYPEDGGKYHVYFPADGFAYYASAETWTNSIAEYKDHFHFDEDHRLVARLSEEGVSQAKLNDLVQAQYQLLYPSLNPKFSTRVLWDEVLEEPEEQFDTYEQDIYDFVEVEPNVIDSIHSILEHIESCASKELKSLFNRGCQANTYFQLIIDEEGEVESANCIRGIEKEFDQKVEECLMDIGPFTPAMQQGKPVKFRMNIPVRVRYE
ncbi:MAG: energy transducer TonB [Flavobacteriales bacterium]|nr:energy transducer TonB [Flavobacteriales bacterium]